MPRPPSHSASHANDIPTSEVPSTLETLFLLSISRDEDDAAALRADLKRSSLRNYKIQHCANLDDALHLLRVCGFDLVFIRLDDYQDKQAAIDLVNEHGPEKSIIALATSRLLASPSFALPTGVDATCRLEDLSPSLVATLVTSTLERKRHQRQQARLEQELQLALEAGQLGRWTLEIETGRVSLDAAAAGLLGAAPSASLDDLLQSVYPEDRDSLRRAIARAIERAEDLQIGFRLDGNRMPLPRIELLARLSEDERHLPQRLIGVLRRHHAAGELHERLARASSAIQRALSLRDEAFSAASAELEAMADMIGGALATDPHPGQPGPNSPASPSRANSATDSETSSAASRPAAADGQATALVPPAEATEPTRLRIDKDAAFRNVLKSLGHKEPETTQRQQQDTFPFDFSADATPDYTEPDPRSEGFAGAAKRLVNITQNGHHLRVSLSIENAAMIEMEAEKSLLYEILRELLTNVVKHARAQECLISVFRDEDDWVLQVEDDGVGLEKNLVSISAPLNQIGLFRIRTKLALKGGQLDLTPTEPRGLIARARLPVNLSRSHGKEHA